MTPAWVSVALGIGAVIGILGAVVRWAVRPMLRAGMTFEALIPLIPTLIKMAKANGNGALAKEVREINRHLDRQDDRLEKIEGKLP